MSEITAGQRMNALKFGAFARITKIVPCGSLEARKLSSGANMFYWRTTLAGKTHREPLGIYDAAASPKSLQPSARGLSVKAAIRAAEDLAQKHYANLDAGGFFALRQAERKMAALAANASEQAEKLTLRALLDDYCDHQKAQGRSSHKDARSIFKLHVFDPWPKLAAKAANELTSEEVADMMRRCLELGKGRTANKLRSYMRAAYQVAKAARTKPAIPVKFKSYAVTHNPVADTEPDETQNRADKNPLGIEDLKRYWRGIKAAPGIRGASLRLHLLTGGQRIEQLVRMRTASIERDAFTILDGKGRPGKPARPHIVPLIPAARAALEECGPSGTYALSTDGGRTHIHATTISDWAMEAAQAAGIRNFQTKRIRSGVETLLAANDVPLEIRGRLQSHGVSGVQARHYDGHDYMTQKRHALEVFYQALDASTESP